MQELVHFYHEQKDRERTLADWFDMLNRQKQQRQTTLQALAVELGQIEHINERHRFLEKYCLAVRTHSTLALIAQY